MRGEESEWEEEGRVEKREEGWERRGERGGVREEG